MSLTLTLPELPLGITEATVVRWLVQPGAALSSGQPVLIVLTESAEIALPAMEQGVFGEPLVAEGASVRVGEAIAQLAAEPHQHRYRITPVARNIASTNQLVTKGVSGSGPNSKLMKRDLMALIDQASPPEPTISADPEALLAPPSVLSVQHQLPLCVTAMEADFGAVRLRCNHTTPHRGPRIDERVCVAHAIVQVLVRHPLLRSQWSEDGLVQHRRIHLLVDDMVVADAQDLNERGVARALATPSTQQQAHTPTFEVTFTDGVWTGGYARQHSILHCGMVRQQPVVLAEDRIAIRPIAVLTLQYDARVLTYAHANAFLRDLCAALANENMPLA